MENIRDEEHQFARRVLEGRIKVINRRIADIKQVHQ